MSNISVDTSVLDRQTTELKSVLEKLNGVSQNVQNVNNSLRWNVSISTRVQKQLGEYSSYVGQLSERTNGLHTALASISNQYQSTENKLANNKTGATATSDSSKSEGSEKGVTLDWTKYLFKGIKKVGIIGSFVGAVGAFLTGGKQVKDGVKLLADLSGTTEKILSAIPKEKASFDWKTLFGAQIKSNKPAGFWNSLKDQIQKYNPKAAKTVTEKGAVAAKWIGVGLTVVAEGIENFTDKENSTGRAIAETIGESAIAIGESILVSAAVGAVLTGAPAVAVGAIATFAINAGLDYAFGGDWKESLSDFVLDNGKKGIDAMADGIGDAVEAGKNTVCKWADKLRASNPLAIFG